MIPDAMVGDGLGPLYNATSCLDCHRQGGPGGAGPASQNVDVVVIVGHAIPRKPGVQWTMGLARRQGDPDYLIQNFFGGRPTPAEQAEMAAVHPGFRTGAPSVVLHRYGVDPRYSLWRPTIKAEIFARGLAIARARRNAPTLFGAGLIDTIPASAVARAAELEPPKVRGRVHEMRDGQIGRFGWKRRSAPSASLSCPPAPASWASRSPATTRPPRSSTPMPSPGDST